MSEDINPLDGRFVGFAARRMPDGELRYILQIFEQGSRILRDIQMNRAQFEALCDQALDVRDQN